MNDKLKQTIEKASIFVKKHTPKVLMPWDFTEIPVAYYNGHEIHDGDPVIETATGKVVGHFRANRLTKRMVFYKEEE